MNSTETQAARETQTLDWCFADTTKVTAELAVKPAEGLSTAEAAARLARFGPNELVERGGKKPWQILLAQFTSKLVLILIVAAVVSADRRRLQGRHRHPCHRRPERRARLRPGIPGGTGHGRAEEAGRRRTCGCAATARSSEIPARDLVPGDIVLLEAGNLVPADGRLLEVGEPAHSGSDPDGRVGAGGETDRGARAAARPRLPWATGATWPSWAPPSPTAAARWR